MILSHEQSNTDTFHAARASNEEASAVQDGRNVSPPYSLGSGSKVRARPLAFTNQDGGRLRTGTKDVKRCLPEDNFTKT